MAKPKPESGMVECLGHGIFKGCKGKFHSTDRINLRFCKNCAAKKDQVQRTYSLKVYGGGREE